MLFVFPHNNKCFDVYTDSLTYPMDACIMIEGHPGAHDSKKLDSAWKSTQVQKKKCCWLWPLLKSLIPCYSVLTSMCWPTRKKLLLMTSRPIRSCRGITKLKNFSMVTLDCWSPEYSGGYVSMLHQLPLLSQITVHIREETCRAHCFWGQR